MISLPTIKIDERTTPLELEQIRRGIVDAVRELQSLPFASEKVIEDITLQDGVSTAIPHGLGRPARWVRESCIRGATSNGRIEEVRDGSVDRTKYVNLRATGFGGPVVVSLRVL
jgi:hypothetical protein